MSRTLISTASFKASVNRLTATVATIDALTAHAVYHALQGQTTPANTLLDAIDAAGIGRSDVAKACREALAAQLKERCTMTASGAVKAMKGADWLSKDAAEQFAVAMPSLIDAVQAMRDKRAAAKDTVKDTKADAGTDSAAGAGTDSASANRAPLSLALESVGKFANDNTAALAAELAKMPGTLALFRAAVAAADVLVAAALAQADRDRAAAAAVAVVAAAAAATTPMTHEEASAVVAGDAPNASAADKRKAAAARRAAAAAAAAAPAML